MAISRLIERLRPAEILGRFARDQRGGMVVAFAISLPVISVLAVGAIDLAAVSSSKADAQGAVDAAALAVAHQLGIDDSGIAARAEQMVREQVNGDRITYVVNTTVEGDGTAVKVALVGKMTSFFGNLLPPGGWDIAATAVAATMNSQPLCVLATGGAAIDIEFKNSSKLQASGCVVHSNGDIKVDGGAKLAAGTVQAAGLAKGPISPAPLEGAVTIDDPFSTLGIRPEDKFCDGKSKIPPGGPKDTAPLTVDPGIHCGDIHVGKDQALTLMPGEHYFLKGKLKLDGNAQLFGKDVVLIFDKESDFDFKEQSQVELEGRKSGVFSGFVLATTRENDHTFNISSSAAAKFLGTIYVPNATLLIDGAGNKVANESAWTVIVAKALKLQGSPTLVVNSSYAGSSVPVPTGVGPRNAEAFLAR